jgi:hypothetical protein
MAFEATFRKGNPQKMDYTPTGGAVVAGQVVVFGGRGLIAVRDIANNELGALDCGDGFYDATMLGNYAAASEVFWDDTNNKLTTTSTNNAKMGVLVEGGTGANTVVEFFHDPGP